MARKKAPALEAPQTVEEAVAVIAEYRDLLDKLDELRLDGESSIARIKAAHDEFAAPLNQRMKDLFIRLRAWWAVAAPSMTDGKTKSVALAGCKIGNRMSTPSLKHDGLKAEQLVEQLADLGMAELLRITTKLDKQACIAAISKGDELGQLLLWLGARNHQTEEFFIDRAEKKAVDPELVSVEEAAE
ncbi:Mu-like prophage host-nuclease inhibitor protein Gam [Sphingobium faniae]|nr:Mu-like prophage host-nuclease inhibitor protein Gam [Sphingobium faniae]